MVPTPCAPRPRPTVTFAEHAAGGAAEALLAAVAAAANSTAASTCILFLLAPLSRRAVTARAEAQRYYR